MPFILMDREAMCVRYRHVNQNVLFNLMAIEFTNTSVVCQGDDDAASFTRYTDLELKLLYQNLTGQKYTGYSRDILVKAVIGLINCLDFSEVNALALASQANHIRDGETGFFKYNPNSHKPTQMEDKYTPAALTVRAGAVPVQPPAPPQYTLPASTSQAAAAPASTPRATSNHTPSEPPKAGGKTARVWEIATQQLQLQREANEKSGAAFDVKALRKAVSVACEAEGMNPSTMSVQFSKWKAANNL
jgi:hypothetical protein